MVIRAGLEPRIAALKGLCPYHLDERTRFTGSFLPALGIGCNKNIINAHTEECCKNDQITRKPAFWICPTKRWWTSIMIYVTMKQQP